LETRFEYASPGIKNMLTLYQALTKQSREEIEEHFSEGKYGKLKKELAEVVIDTLKPIQQKYRRIINDQSYLEQVLNDGKEKAAKIAETTMDEVKKSMGLK
ncbi:MAG: tryptophan--tRNA ligase, partial [Halanaerobium sp.]